MAKVRFFRLFNHQTEERVKTVTVISKRLAYVKRVAMTEASKLFLVEAGSWRHTYGQTHVRMLRGKNLPERQFQVIINMGE